MVKLSVTLINELGLHARAAAQVVRLAAKYDASVTLSREDTGKTADARSILSILQMAATRGTRLTLTADGSEEQEALDAVGQLFADGFGEMNL